MREIPLQFLTRAGFNKFGTFERIIDPGEERFENSAFAFYRDLIPLKMGTVRTSWSVCRVAKQEFLIKEVEHSNHFEKAFLPLDGDIIVFVAPVTSAPRPFPLDRFSAFLVPRGTMVKLRKGVWHHAPLGYDKPSTNILVISSARFVTTDLFASELPPEDFIRITVP